MIARITPVHRTLPSYTAQQRSDIKRLNTNLTTPDLLDGERAYWREVDGKGVVSYAKDAYGYFTPESRLDFPAEIIDRLYSILHPHGRFYHG